MKRIVCTAIGNLDHCLHQGCDTIERLAEQFELSDEQKGAKNKSELNVFRYDVVAPQFKRLLREGKLEQPNGPRTPYFLTESDPEPANLVLGETHSQPELSLVERTTADRGTGEEHQIALPATRVVKEARLDFDYPPSGIRIKDIAEALADQFDLTEEQREARGNGECPRHWRTRPSIQNWHVR